MVRTRPLKTYADEERRLEHARTRRKGRWRNDIPNGTSFRQMRRAILAGYSKPVKIKNPNDYITGHARRRAVSQ